MYNVTAILLYFASAVEPMAIVMSSVLSLYIVRKVWRLIRSAI
nr:MAG TPA: hypothetical protein [Inoviridae sp.]